MKLRSLLVLIFIGSFGLVYAQNTVPYSNYYLNPSLYNPAWVGSSGYSEAFFNFRKQWVGFEGAPTTATLNLHLPLNYKSSIGFSAFQDQAGILRTTSGMISFAHQVHFGTSLETNHKLAFGLSAGITNSFLKDPDNPNDPAVLNNTTSFVNGQFGTYYQFKNLSISFAIPSLFKTFVTSDATFNKPSFEALQNTISSLSYRFNFSAVSFEPFLIYRTSEIENQFEGLGILTIKNLVWVGGSYKQNNGAAALGGIKLDNKLKLGYAYEFSTGGTAGYNNGTHEIQLAIRIGKKQVQRTSTAKKEVVAEETAPVVVEELKKIEEPIKEEVTPPVVIPVVVEKKIEPVTEVIKKEEEPKAVIQEEPKPVVQEVPKPIKQDPRTVEPGHYVVVGAFRMVTNASSYAEQLQRNNYPAQTVFIPSKKYFIVYVGMDPDLEKAKEIRNRIKKQSRFTLSEAWILSIK